MTENLTTSRPEGLEKTTTPPTRDPFSNAWGGKGVAIQAAALLALGYALWWILLPGYDHLIFANALVNTILALGLLLTLRAGRLSLAQASLAGVGGYVSAYIAVHSQVNLLLTLILGALVAGVVGALVGILALRLHGFYFVIATLAFSQIFTIVTGAWQSVTGGLNGIIGIPRLSTTPGGTFDFSFAGGYTGYSLLLLAAAAICFVIVGLATGKNRVGRAISAVGEDDTLAAALGAGVTRWRVAAFVVGSLMAGFAGAVQASYLGAAAPTTYNINASVLVLAMVYLGGSRSLPGAVVGAFALTYIPEWLRFGDQTQLLFTGLFFIFIAFALPKGLLPTLTIVWRHVTSSRGRRAIAKENS